jgi:hypothetical protein
MAAQPFIAAVRLAAAGGVRGIPDALETEVYSGEMWTELANMLDYSRD